MWTRKDLKDQAKAGLKRNYWKGVLIGLLATLMTAAVAANGKGDGTDITAVFSGMSSGEILGVLGVLFSAALVGILFTAVIHAIIYNPLKVGISAFCMEAVEGEAPLKAIGKGYTSKFFGNVWALFLRDLFVFLWSLLLVVPGIIKAYEYRLVEYICAENVGISPTEAMAKSKALMQGQKWNAFVLDLSFLGWNILNACTFGILGIFYVQPYQMLTNAALYKKLTQNT